MPFKKLRSFIAVLALLAFTGQTLASVVVSCASMEAGSPHSGHMAEMDHAAHAMPDSTASWVNASPVDCCGEALCLMKHCGGPAFGAATGPRLALYGAGVLNTGYSLSYRPPEAVSLFRPPITR